MKRITTMLLVSLLSATIVLAGSSDNFLSVDGAYVRGLPPSVKNTSAYMTINNSSDEVMVLIGAKTDIAESVMVHRTENDSGMMSMQHMMIASIPAHGRLVLETGGIHLMIMGLKAPVASGDTVEISLIFEGGTEYVVSMPVRSVLDE